MTGSFERRTGAAVSLCAAILGVAMTTGAAAQTTSGVWIAPGVRHTALLHAEGPWAMHIVEVDLAACGIDLRGAKGAGQVIGRETTSAMARTAAASLGRPVLAAVNADFFTFDPPGRPESAQVINGVMVRSEARLRASTDSGRSVAQPVFAVDAGERPLIFAPAFEGAARIGSRWWPIAAVNPSSAAAGLVLYNTYVGRATPSDSAVVERVLRPVNRTLAGDTAVGVVGALDTVPDGVPLERDAVVLAARGAAAEALRRAASGDTVRWFLRIAADAAPIAEAIGGLPPMLSAARDVYRDTYVMPASFVDQRHPRTAVGWDASGRIFLVVVDGRQPGYSEGMTLAELAAYLRGLGVREALNLDGGGSTTLVVRGGVVNRPSDAEGERAVANALLVLGPPPGACAA